MTQELWGAAFVFACAFASMAFLILIFVNVKADGGKVLAAILTALFSSLTLWGILTQFGVL
jgi:hypothetical protein